jgi:hypothetical protein
MVQHPFRRKSPYLEPVEEGKNPTPEIPGAEGNPAEKPEEAGQPFVPSPMPDTASKNTKEETPARPVGGALQQWQVDKFADDKWMDAMAEHPRVKKYAAQMDEIVHFMTKREYKTGNPAMDAVRGPVVLGVWLFLFVFVFLLGWSLLAPLSSAAVAAGSVVLDTNKKVIQHLEGGIIEEILVKEGE